MFGDAKVGVVLHNVDGGLKAKVGVVAKTKQNNTG